MSHPDYDHGTTHQVRTFGAAVATVCVVGLAGLIFLHAERQGSQSGATAYVTPATATNAAANAFLHAPATDSSVPSADQVFASHPTAEGAGESAPTF